MNCGTKDGSYKKGRKTAKDHTGYVALESHDRPSRRMRHIKEEKKEDEEKEFVFRFYVPSIVF